MGQEMTDLQTAFKRIDEHAKKLGEHDIKLAIQEGDIRTIQRDMNHICKILHETKSEVVTRQESIVKTLDMMQKDSAKSEGKMEALGKLPIILTALVALLQIWVLIRK
jgi:hypothetical protein